MAHTWYLAADMQIHVIAPLILVPLFLSRTFGFILGGFLLFATTILNYFIIMKYDFPVNYVGFFMEYAFFFSLFLFFYDDLVFLIKYAEKLSIIPLLVAFYDLLISALVSCLMATVN